MKPNVIKKWRKSVSVIERDDGTFAICRWYPDPDNERGRWRQVLYFNTAEDLDEFIDAMDEAHCLITGQDLNKVKDEVAA